MDEKPGMEEGKAKKLATFKKTSEYIK